MINPNQIFTVNTHTQQYIDNYIQFAIVLQHNLLRESYEYCQHITQLKNEYKAEVKNILSRDHKDEDPELTLSIIEYIINRNLRLPITTELPYEWMEFLQTKS